MSPTQKYTEPEHRYVNQLLSHQDTDRPKKSYVHQFEEAFCNQFGVDYAVACNSGTSALHAACFAAGIGPGDEVIIPALTVVMDAYAVIHCGGTPVYADIDPKTFLIDPTDIARKITPKTKAIIPVSMFGLSVDIDAIMDLANTHNLIVIEDTCQNVMGLYKGDIAGTKAHMHAWSFENKKHITTGSEGGLLSINDEALATRARKFAGIGYKHMTATAGRTSLAMSDVQHPFYERFDTIGLNYRMNEISAAVGLGQLERLDEIINKRKACGKLFEEAVADCSFMIPQAIPDDYESSYYTFAVRYLGDQEHNVSWQTFYQRYIEFGGDGFYGACQVPYREPVFQNDPRYAGSLAPHAEHIQRQLMQFKTNYRDLDLAKRKATILRKLIMTLQS